MKLRHLILSAFLVGTPLHLANAAGSSSEPTSTIKNCKKGEVYDKKKKQCMDKDSAMLDDDQLLDNGRALAYAGRFDEAFDVLNEIKNKQTAEVQNYLGFSSRKSGDVETGLTYYRVALTLDPDYTLARSYMGQALLNKGDRAGALLQLAEIEKRVGKDVYEYKLLAASLKEQEKTGLNKY